MPDKELAAKIRGVKMSQDTTIRFSECITPDKHYGWITTTDPRIMRVLCDMFNNRERIADALDNADSGDDSPS